MINAWCGTRGSTPYYLRNKHVDFQSDRKVFGVLRPRVSVDMRTDKTHKEASKVKNSEAGTLRRTIECGCPEGEDHDSKSVLCEIPYWEEIFVKKDPVWKAVNEWCKVKKLSQKETLKVWGDESFFPRLQISNPDENGERWPIGFKCAKGSRMGINTMRQLVS